MGRRGRGKLSGGERERGGEIFVPLYLFIVLFHRFLAVMLMRWLRILKR